MDHKAFDHRKMIAAFGIVSGFFSRLYRLYRCVTRSHIVSFHEPITVGLYFFFNYPRTSQRREPSKFELYLRAGHFAIMGQAVRSFNEKEFEFLFNMSPFYLLVNVNIRYTFFRIINK